RPGVSTIAPRGRHRQPKETHNMHATKTLGLALGALMAAALALTAGAAGGKTVTLTDDDLKKDNVKVELAKGDKLQLKLAANPTTGFTWVIGSKDNPALKSAGKPEYTADKKGKVGGGGVQVFTFTAEAAGEADLEMQYKRPFEKDKEPAKTYKFKVVIKQ